MGVNRRMCNLLFLHCGFGKKQNSAVYKCCRICVFLQWHTHFHTHKLQARWHLVCPCWPESSVTSGTVLQGDTGPGWSRRNGHCRCWRSVETQYAYTQAVQAAHTHKHFDTESYLWYRREGKREALTGSLKEALTFRWDRG